MSTSDRGFLVLSATGAFAAVILLIRLAVFATYPDPPAAWSVAPWSAFMTHHACTTAYWVAATEVGRGTDLYAPSTYSVGQDPATGRPIPRMLGPFPVDPFEYPPTFLLVPRVLAAIVPEYAAFRQTWLLLDAAFVLGGLIVVARWIDARTGGRSLWLVPLTIVPLTTVFALQMGNAQLGFIVLAILALLAFERRWPAVGGLFLAYAIVSKMFPGLLLIYLAVRREWRAVGWTAAWMVALTLLTLAVFGWTPFAHFLDHLPRLLSGEAFPMLRQPAPPTSSHSVPGLVLKLPSFGGPAVPFVVLKYAGWIYTAVILWATVRLARRPLAPGLEPLAWLTVLGLAALRSPFIPTYGAFPAVWIASVLIALCWTDVRRRLVLLALWLVLVPTSGGPAPVSFTVIAVMTTLQTAAILAVFALAVRVGRAAAGPTVIAAAA
jgi:hypothetical protein